MTGRPFNAGRRLPVAWEVRFSSCLLCYEFLDGSELTSRRSIRVQSRSTYLIHWPLLYANKELNGKGTLLTVSEREWQVAGDDAGPDGHGPEDMDLARTPRRRSVRARGESPLGRSERVWT